MADTIDRLEIQVQTQAQRANTELDKMASKLEKVSSVLSKITENGGIARLSAGIDNLSTSMQHMSNVKTTDFTRLAKNIEKLGNINQAGINNTANALREIASALTASNVSGDALKGLSDLANSISRLGYKSVTNAITNLPLLAQSMRQFMETLSTAPQVSANLIQMTNAMANLAAQGSKYSSTINSISRATNTLTKAQNQSYKSSINLIARLSKLSVAYYVLRRAVRAAMEPIQSAMDFGETINLFQTSFKKIGMQAAEYAGMEWGSEAANAFAKTFIDYAQSFNDKITESLSLDPNITMKYQAIFAQMANAFGLTSRSVMNLSSSFTMLGLDIASLFNVDIEEAMVKLRAGLAGETEPLRALGVDITEATLKLTALKYGIEDSIESMSQAAKTQLRWLAIMEQTEVAFGDMAKTIDSPANQIRVLRQQIENLTRSIGSVFLPVIQTVLPYVNAVVIVIRRLVETIAQAAGYELPNYMDSDIYRDISGDIGAIGDSADDANTSVTKLKKTLASFDELNILGDSKVKGINLNLNGGYDTLDDAIAQKTTSYMAKFSDELAKMSNKAKEIAEEIQPKIEKFVEWMGKIKPILEGIAAAFIAYKVIDWFTDLAKAIGNFHLGPAGIVALAVGAIAAIYEAVKEYNKKLVEEDLASRFGEISASMQEIEDIAQRLTESEYSAKIDIFISEKANLEDMEKAIQSDIETLNKLNWKISVGIELTEGEIEQYKSAIESFIKNTEDYIEQQHYVTKLAIDAVIQDENFKQEISDLVDKYFDGSKGEMARLGKQLRSEMDKALADGVIDAEEQKVINNLIKEINEIQNRVASAEFKAKLQLIQLEGDLTPDSYKKLFEQIQSAINERAKSAEEAAFTLMASVNASYQIKMDEAKTAEEKAKIQREWEADIKEIQDNLNQTKAEISYDGITFATNKLYEKWDKEFSLVEQQLAGSTQRTLEQAINMGIIGIDPSTDMNNLVSNLYNNYSIALANSGMDRASRKALESMLEYLIPTEEDNQKIFDEALKTGSKVPDAIVEELSSIENLRALTGSVDGIYFTVGQRMADSPEIIKMLANGELSAKDLDDSIIRGLKSKIPDLKKEGDNLIFNVGDAVKKAADSKAKNDMPSAARTMINGISSTLLNDTAAKSAARQWLDGIASEVKGYKMPNVKVGVVFDYEGIPSFISKSGQLVQQYASGGFPNTGELFLAREKGPELVGRIGSRTAVANNDQITEGIATAVENAMINVLVPALVSMNSGGDGVIDNRIYLDSNVLYEAMERVRYKKDRQTQTAR